jgi:ribosome maturation factor RimP
LEKDLDENGWLGETYVLEVGSAGITRPLEMPRQYIKNIGRTLKLQLREGEDVEGEIVAADQEGVTLSFEKVTKEGKKKIKQILTPKYPYTNIKKAVVKVKF